MRIIGNIHNRFAAAILTLLAVSLHLTSCDDSLRRALEYAGDNRHELERVLEYYENAGDPQKLAAAEYLIANMPWHKSYSGTDAYYHDLENLISLGMERDCFKSVMDSLYRIHEQEIGTVCDIRTIKAEYLIDEIDRSYLEWKYGRWGRHLDFSGYCEYLLPYKCQDLQPMDDWRSRSIGYARGEIDRMERECREYNMNASAAAFEVNSAMQGGYLKYTKQLELYPIFRPDILLNLPYGTCAEACAAAVQVQRSKGIPVALDYTPQWANRKYGHTWLSVCGNKGRNEPFSPFGIEPDVLQNRPLSKVYRMTYAVNPEMRRRLSDGLPVPSGLGGIFFKDVTREYVITSDVDIPLWPGKRYDNLYLATFNNQEWVPVCPGEMKSGHKARFVNIGRGVLYLPVQCLGPDRCEAAGNPFYLDYSGQMIPIRISSENHTSVNLFRKYPVYEFVYRNSSKIRGGVLEFAGSASFENSAVIAEFPYDSLALAGYQELDGTTSCRFIKFRSSDDGRCDMAELIFYDIHGGRLEPSLVCCGREVHPENKVNLATAINDNDPLTFFSARGEDDIWVGFDFGKEVILGAVDYFRRSDGNNLYPGYEYVLYWWNGQTWMELKRAVADKTLCFSADDVPVDCLLLLRCLTTGTESRPFIYNQGEIVWY